MSSRCASRREVADDIGPFARRGERDRAGPLADGEAFDRTSARYRSRAASRSPSAANRSAPSVRSSDLQVTQTRRVAAERRCHGHSGLCGVAMRQHRASVATCGGPSARRRGSGVIALLGRPSGGVCGIHRRTAGLLARGVSPTPPSRTWIKSSGEKSVGTPLTVAGAATDRPKAYRVPFSPSGRSRDRAGSCSSFAGGCQMRRGLR